MRKKDDKLMQRIVECFDTLCRNGFQHPERSQVKFDRETVENWRDTVFAIKGE